MGGQVLTYHTERERQIDPEQLLNTDEKIIRN